MKIRLALVCLFAQRVLKLRKALQPGKYFIVTLALFANGEVLFFCDIIDVSRSLSSTVFFSIQYGMFAKKNYDKQLNHLKPPPHNGPYFPAVSYEDNMSVCFFSTSSYYLKSTSAERNTRF